MSDMQKMAKLRIEETLDGYRTDIDGAAYKLLKLYGLLTMSIIQNTGLTMKHLEVAVEVIQEHWADINKDSIVIDSGKILESLKKIALKK